MGPTDDQALREGAAVELSYATPQGTLTVFQGPTEELRDILRQRPARWRRSELREALGSNGLAWVMHGEQPKRQWAAFERGTSLLFLEHDGPEAELDQILERLPQLVLVPKTGPR
jgi:hypothetical protein